MTTRCTKWPDMSTAMHICSGRQAALLHQSSCHRRCSELCPTGEQWQAWRKVCQYCFCQAPLSRQHEARGRLPVKLRPCLASMCCPEHMHTAKLEKLQYFTIRSAHLRPLEFRHFDHGVIVRHVGLPQDAHDMLLHQLQCLLAVDVLSQGLQDSGRVSLLTSLLLKCATHCLEASCCPCRPSHKHQDRTATAQLLQALGCQPAGLCWTGSCSPVALCCWQ